MRNSEWSIEINSLRSMATVSWTKALYLAEPPYEVEPENVFGPILEGGEASCFGHEHLSSLYFGLPLRLVAR